MGQHFDIFPVLIIGNNAYQGNNAVESGLLRELSFFAKHGDYLKRQKNFTFIANRTASSLPGFRFFSPVLLMV